MRQASKRVPDSADKDSPGYSQSAKITDDGMVRHPTFKRLVP